LENILKRQQLPFLLAVAAAAGLACTAATAAPAQVSALSGATAGTTVGVPAGVNNTPVYANSGTSATEAGVGNSSGSAFANQNGAYATGSETTGKGNANAAATLSYSLINNTSVAQSYSMSFFVYGGSVSTLLADPGIVLTSGEFLRSDYVAEISRVGVATPLFRTGAVLEYADFGSGFTHALNLDGTNLSNDTNVSDGVYDWSGQTFVIALGSLNPGESMLIQASLATFVSSNVGTYDFGGGPGGYGCGSNYPTATLGLAQPTVAEVPDCFEGAARAFYGDPAGVQGSGPGTGANNPPIVITATALTNGVPLPGTGALAALALLAAAGIGRKRKLN
jgi:hypothetical protein